MTRATIWFHLEQVLIFILIWVGVSSKRPCIVNQLRDVNTICRRSWYIAAHIWKIYDLKIEVIPFIIHFSADLTTVDDNICVSFGGILFQQVIGIPMGTNCATLLADLFLYSYESEFFQKFVKDKKIHEKHMWICTLTQQILSHSFYDWKLCELFLLRVLSINGRFSI
jgi:hypothetical protein